MKMKKCVRAIVMVLFVLYTLVLLYLMFVGVVLWRGPRLYAPSAWSKRDWAGVVLVSLMLVLLFSLHWSTFFLRLCGGSKATSHLLMMALAVTLAFGGSVFLSSVLRMMRESCPEASQVFVLRHGAKSPLWNSDVLISLLLAFLVLRTPQGHGEPRHVALYQKTGRGVNVSDAKHEKFRAMPSHTVRQRKGSPSTGEGIPGERRDAFVRRKVGGSWRSGGRCASNPPG